MDYFTEHYEGISGGLVEFQITHVCGLDNIQHWQKDSLYAPDLIDLAFNIFQEKFGDCWFYDFNQIDYTETIKLVKSLQEAKVAEELTAWILNRAKPSTYLNVLGV